MPEFKVFRSSAGSGKTFNLVLNYLLICLQAEHPSKVRQILALTFTNKAAQEMKERIMGSLADLSDERKPSTYLNTLCEHTGMPEKEVREKSRKLLSYILHHYAHFSVSTIDGFIFKLIRSFSRDLQLDTDLQVEMDLDGFRERMISLLIAKAGDDREITEVLNGFSEFKIEEDKSYQIEKDLFEMAKLASMESNRAFVEVLENVPPNQLIELQEHFRRQRAEIGAQFRQMGDELFTLLEHTGGDAQSFVRSSQGIWSYANKVKYFKNNSEELPDPNSYVISCLAQDTWHNTKAPQDVQQAIASAATEISQRVRDILNFIESHQHYFVVTNMVRPHLFTVALIGEMERLSHQLSLQENIVLISDFNRTISAFIRNEQAPFIFERIGNRYQYFMLDEFQDTSVMQWRNLLPLVTNALSSGGSAMLFGDSKQAIYRWRNGEWRQFHLMPSLFPPAETSEESLAEKLLGSYFVANPLDDNWRSHKEIVSFNNTFFETLAQSVVPLLKETGYEHAAQNCMKTDDQGYVTCSFLESKAEKSEHIEKAITLLRDCMSRGAAADDICILVRTNAEGAEVAKALMALQIPVISQECLHLGANLFARAMMGMMGWLANNSHPGYGLDVIQLLKSQHRAGDVHEYIKNNGKADSRFYDSEIMWEKLLHNAGISTNKQDFLAASLVQTLNMIASYLHVKQDDAVYSTLLDLLNEFQKRKGFNLTQLMHWWEEKGRTISLAGDASVPSVQIMTVHKAKGLQFPVVILPFCNWTLGFREAFTWIANPEKDHAIPYLLTRITQKLEKTEFAKHYLTEYNQSVVDNINLLYVAFTRPICELHIVSNTSENALNLTHTGEAILQSLSKIHPDNEQSTYVFGKPFQFSSSFYTEPTSRSIKPISAPKSPNFVVNSQSLARKTGEQFHAFIATCRSAEDVPEALSKYRVKTGMDQTEFALLQDRLSKILDDDAVRQVIFPEKYLEIISEQEFCDQHGNILRPDRIIETEDNLVVIDFKTGALEKEKYIIQMNNYAACLSNIWHKKVISFIIYTDKLTIQPVVNA